MGDEEKGKSTESSSRQTGFDPDVITEEDIERIWWQMQKESADLRNIERKRELNLCSTDTTPTTDYSSMYFVQSEGGQELLKNDKETARTQEVLQIKRRKPKTYLTQVILYDNVNRQRILQQKLGQLQHRHHAVEKRIKRRKESFVQKLENKQNEWTRLDARVAHKFNPENMPELTFKFGRLYHNANYPYQAAIKSLRGIQPPNLKPPRRPMILPQITRRARKHSTPVEDDSSSQDVFITRLPKKSEKMKKAAPKQENNPPSKTDEITASWNNIERATHTEKPDEPRNALPPIRGRRGPNVGGSQKNWLEDSRYVTLTSLLGPRFSASTKHMKNTAHGGLIVSHGQGWQ